jgi:urea transport system permease protein
VIWVAIGGRGTLYGAVAGAALVNYAKTAFSTALPSGWLYFLGLLFVLSTLLLPRGFVGLGQKLLDRKKAAAATPATTAEAKA